MSKVMQDIYVLGQSDSKSIINVEDSIKLDIKLNKDNKTALGTNLYGIVADINGNPIPKAVVQIMSDLYKSLTHTNTDKKGIYTFNNVSKDTLCYIFVNADGYKSKQSNKILVAGDSIKIDFVLDVDASFNLCKISGVVVDSSTTNNIFNAKVYLFKLENSNYILTSMSYTNENGAFIFSDIQIGEYMINVVNLGYNESNVNVSLTKQSEIIDTKITITAKQNYFTGLLSGYINVGNNYVNGADVILYKLETDTNFAPVAFTKTNESGAYLFSNISTGEYKIESNISEMVSADFSDTWSYSPNFKSFEIISLDESFKKVYYPKDVALYGAAIIDNGFIKNVGSLLGYIIIGPITLQNSSEFNLVLEYSCDGNNKFCNISVNSNSYSEIYTFENTDGITTKYKTIKVSLDSGDNFIKVYNPD